MEKKVLFVVNHIFPSKTQKKTGRFSVVDGSALSPPYSFILTQVRKHEFRYLTDNPKEVFRTKKNHQA